MKEELQLKLVEILTSIQSAAGKTADFAMEQLPDIAQSYVMYGRVWAVVYLLTCAALIEVLRRVGLKYSKASDGTVWIPVGLSIFSLVVTGAHVLNEALLVWLAPKVWLIKELASLIK